MKHTYFLFNVVGAGLCGKYRHLWSKKDPPLLKIVYAVNTAIYGQKKTRPYSKLSMR